MCYTNINTMPAKTTPLHSVTRQLRRIHLFLAKDLVPREQHLDEDEFLSVRPLPFDEVMKMTRGGEIQDAMTLAALQLFDLIGKGRSLS